MISNVSKTVINHYKIHNSSSTKPLKIRRAASKHSNMRNHEAKLLGQIFVIDYSKYDVQFGK